jgi:phenylacetate-CoA ligase
MLSERPEFTGEFLCRVERHASGRDKLTVVAEVTANPSTHAALRPIYASLLKSKLGIAVHVEFAAPGELKELTGIERRQKPIRLLDRRI